MYHEIRVFICVLVCVFVVIYFVLLPCILVFIINQSAMIFNSSILFNSLCTRNVPVRILRFSLFSERKRKTFLFHYINKVNDKGNTGYIQWYSL